MKALIIGPFPPPVNGCSYANQVLLQNVLERGISCDFIDTNTDQISSNQGSHFSFKKALTFIPIYANIYKVFSCKVVYITPGQTFFGLLKYAPFILLSILLGKPYIIHIHGNYLGEHYRSLKGLKRKFFRFLISRAGAGIVLSKSLLKNFEGLLPQERLYIVENFAGNDLYAAPSAVKKADKPRLLYLSNLMSEKGIFDLLDALLILQTRNIDFHAVLAGVIEDGRREEILEKCAKISGKLEYIGPVTGKAKREQFAGANIFILPTYYPMEGQPISLLEGLATGNIIISTRHAGIPDIIGSQQGFLIEPRSPAAIAAVVEELALNLETYVQKFSAPNREYAALHFTEAAFTAKIIDIFSKVT